MVLNEWLGMQDKDDLQCLFVCQIAENVPSLSALIYGPAPLKILPMYKPLRWITLPVAAVALTALVTQIPGDPAQAIADRAIRRHGGPQFDGVRITFDFRQYHLRVERKGGRLNYRRTYRDSLGNRVSERMTNDAFTRRVNARPQSLSDQDYKRYYEAVNAVVYLSLLPYRLNDAGVLKQYLGTVPIKGRPYHKVQVSFTRENGGSDFRDVFYYWFGVRKNTMDYFAYGAGGNRFRQAVNRRAVKGILFQDYINHTHAEGDTTALVHFDRLFDAGKLVVLSKIGHRNIRVKPLR